MINIRITPNGDFLPSNIEKDPADVVDVIVDFSQYFKTDTITTATVVGTNITIDSSALSSNTVTIFISAGTDGTDGEIKLTVSSATRTLERSILVKVEDK
jgi:hypothetical protein